MLRVLASSFAAVQLKTHTFIYSKVSTYMQGFFVNVAKPSKIRRLSHFSLTVDEFAFLFLLICAGKPRVLRRAERKMFLKVSLLLLLLTESLRFEV